MSNISSAQRKLSATTNNSANLDIESYSIDELVSILNINPPFIECNESIFNFKTSILLL